jgi:formylglycine-generating enzyme required for sulfatase activity
MSGNVAEWTSTVFDETSSSYTNDMDGDNSNLGGNFDIKNGEKEIQRKVIRGGSWKDIAYYIQTSTRDYEYSNESTSYIGFRCVMDFLGRDLKDNK